MNRPSDIAELSNSIKITDQFAVAERVSYAGKAMPFNRRDFYKISLTFGTGRLFYADKGVEVSAPALIFSNPMIPYAWEPVSAGQDGFFCLFTENFLKVKEPELILQQFPLFKIGADPVFIINADQQDYISVLFRQMLLEYHSEYINKFDLLRNHVNLLLHEAMKMQPSVNYFKHQNAAERITSLFLKLLDRQFPVDSPQHALKLNSQ